jgi:alkanesulfonate monooxygenase SsuD/methylene tetrahydromethanopterin reductase-like flavin-dependent oxidoreductase (luciferase family)
MSGLKVGFVLKTMEDPGTGNALRWPDLERNAVLAEQVGFDTVWVADELQWESDEWDEPIGWWECVALTGAVAASTESVNVGTWVLSALHRNPGLTARIAETLDEISGGRFIFGFGSGHAGRQGEAFGFPSDYTVSRYEEALSIITSLRASGATSLDGEYHTAKDLILAPGSRGNRKIPLLLGGHGPRMMRLAVENADIWSGFATTSSQPEAFADMLASVNEVCGTIGRDPATLEKSIGVFVAPPDLQPPEWMVGFDPIQGSVDQIIDSLSRFEALGCTRLEIMGAGPQDETIEGLAPVIDAVKPS